jgi:BTB/POZ domain
MDVRSPATPLTVYPQVDGTLFCIHRYFFSRDSVYFSTRLAQLGIREHEALPIIISLGDVERKDFEAFLSVIYPEWVDSPFLSLSR